MFSELVMLVCFTMLQHHRGRPPQSPVWVFGMVDVSHKPALGYLEIVPQRDAATLLPIIQAHSNPETEIWSDEWRAYSQVPSLPNITTHRTVNHSLHFKDPVTGVHTNHIESYWNRVKVKLKRMRGCHRHQLPSYLDEFMWFERHGKTAQQAFVSICRDIALKYPL